MDTPKRGRSKAAKQFKIEFKEAKNAYVHRYTMEFVPQWSEKPAPNGKFYAPQYRTDREWFENTQFPPNNPLATGSRDTSCFSSNQSWPLGQWLDKPFKKRTARAQRERVKCNQCEMLSINGVACHERGCPNSNSRWDVDSQDWIKQRKCFECGCTVDANDPCCSNTEWEGE